MKTKYLILPIVAMMTATLVQGQPSLLGSAGSFAVLGNTTVTSTGNTILNGNLGVSPGTAITGFPPGIVNGTTDTADLTAQQAQTDATTAYVTFSGETFTESLTGQDLGGLTLYAGIYNFSSSAQLTGILTLDAQGDPNAMFVIQIGSTLTTASGATVELINDAQADDVYWEVGSSATLGTGTSLAGTILANQSITLNTGAELDGRALALNGAVTLDNNLITVPIAVPEPSVVWLLAFGSVGFGIRHRFSRSGLR